MNNISAASRAFREMDELSAQDSPIHRLHPLHHNKALPPRLLSDGHRTGLHGKQPCPLFRPALFPPRVHPQRGQHGPRHPVYCR